MQRSKPVLWFLPTLFGLTAVGALAQIQELATTRDGSQLVFSTPFRQKGTEQFSSFKIFQYSSGSYSLIGQTAPFVSLPNGTREQDDFHLPNMSGDGQIVAWDEVVECTFVTGFCKPNVENSQTTRGFVSGADLPAEMKTGSLRVSRNGRYFLRFCCSNTGDVQSLLFYDATTGTLTPIAGYSVYRGTMQGVADDGTLILVRNQDATFVLWNNGATREIPLRNGTRETLRLSADASVLAYQTRDPLTGNGVLVARDLNTGAEVTLVSEPVVTVGGGFCSCSRYVSPNYLPWVSDDGRRVVFLHNDSKSVVQAFVASSDGTGVQPLTAETAGIAYVTVSGDGHIAYAATANNAVIKINTDTLQTERLLPEMPTVISDAVNTPVPGSRLYVNGDLLATPEGGSLVSLAGVPAPLLSAKQRLVTLQVPWEYDASEPVTVVASAADSPFEYAQTVSAAVAAPLILDIKSADFSSDPRESPATAASTGDIVVLQMTGLGPVMLQVATGEPAPLDRLSYLQSPFGCEWTVGGVIQPADVLFAGLAPTLVGSYQVNVRTPSVAPFDMQEATIVCSVTIGNSKVSTQPLGNYIFLRR